MLRCFIITENGSKHFCVKKGKSFHLCLMNGYKRCFSLLDLYLYFCHVVCQLQLFSHSLTFPMNLMLWVFNKHFEQKICCFGFSPAFRLINKTLNISKVSLHFDYLQHTEETLKPTDSIITLATECFEVCGFLHASTT